MPNTAQEQDRYQPPAECIRAARAHLAEVMRSLKVLSIDEGERCTDLLGEAAMQLRSAAAMLSGMERPGDAKLRTELEQLRRQLKTLAYALTESDRLVSGWIRRMGATRGGLHGPGRFGAAHPRQETECDGLANHVKSVCRIKFRLEHAERLANGA